MKYPVIRYTEQLAEAGAAPSVGTRGDSYDGALVESFNGLYKTEFNCHAFQSRGFDDVKYATPEHPNLFNHRRLHCEFRIFTPSGFEAAYNVTPAPALLASSR